MALRAHWPNRLRLHPFEIVALVQVAAVVLFLRSQGLRADWKTVDYVVTPLLKELPLYFFLGAGLVVVARALRREPLSSYWREIRRPSWLLLWLRLWLAFLAMSYAYFWLKVSVPLLNERLWDHRLWDLDATLHGGLAVSVFVTRLFEGTILVPALDHWYGAWLTSSLLIVALTISLPGERLRKHLLLSLFLMWAVAPWIYLSLPALGPVYVFPEVWTGLYGTMPKAEGTQYLLWENYQKMVAGRETGLLTSFNPTRGVAAMPSLHVGQHFLFFLWVRRYLRSWTVLAFLAPALTFVGSILTGWHYAVDGYVGCLLAYGGYRLAIWWQDPEAPPVDS